MVSLRVEISLIGEIDDLNVMCVAVTSISHPSVLIGYITLDLKKILRVMMMNMT